MIILALLSPPIYLLVNKRMVAFVITGAMFLLACVLALTWILIPVSLVLWLLAMIPAIWHYKNARLEQLIQRHTDLAAEKMTKALSPQNPPPLPQPPVQNP